MNFRVLQRFKSQVFLLHSSKPKFNEPHPLLLTLNSIHTLTHVLT